MKWHGQKAWLLIFLVLVSWLSVFHFVPLVHAVEEVYVDAFDSTYLAWVEMGSSPYLQDTDLDYIYKLTSTTVVYDEGCWSFPSSAGSGTINSVKLRFEDKRTDLSGDADVKVYVWDGASWIDAGWITALRLSYGWDEKDVSSILNTWAKINGAKVYLEISMAEASTDIITVRRCTREVDYTSTIPEYDYVDSQTDVDSHADHGTHSSFTAEKATDWTNDTLIEANTNTTAANNSENFVDNNSSDVDSHANHGTSSNFTAQQDSNVLYNDTLTEANTAGTTSDVFTDGFEDGTFGKWDGNGATTWTNDGGICTNSSNLEGWASTSHSGTYYAGTGATGDGNLVSDNIDLSGITSFGVSFWYAVDDTDGAGELVLQYWDGAAYDTIADLSGGTEDTWTYYSAVITDNQYFDATFRIDFLAACSSNEAVYIDDVVINRTLANNYELDLEFQWSTADFDEAYEYLCIRTGDTLNGESLLVQVRDTTWKTILTIASADVNTWKNASLNGNLTGATITFRFVGNTESSDTTSSTWEIECALIHVWSVGVNYELDLEEQFSSANFSRTYVELCIRMGDFNTSENLQVDYWNASSSAWVTTVAALTENDWTNTSVKAYTSNASVTFTIRLLGTSESGDSERSLWDKDACLLHTWDALAAGLTAILSASTLMPSTLQFLKELSFQGTQSTNVVSSLINNRAVPFSFDGLLAAVSSVTQALALAFTVTGLTRIFGSLDFGKSLGFSHSGLLNVVGSIQNWQAKGFGLDGLVKTLDYSAFNKGLLFSQTGTLQVLESLSVARALGLSLSELPKTFASLAGNNALQFQTTNTLLIASTSDMNKALGFLTTGLPKLFDSASFGKGLGFLNTNSLNILASNSIGNALSFGLTGITNAWSSLGIGQEHGFGLQNTLNAWDTLLANKAIDFSVSQFISILDYGSAVFEVSAGVAKFFDLSGIVYAFDTGIFNKATGFLTTNTVSVLSYNSWNNAFGFSVTNALKTLDYTLLNRGLGFLNTNSLSALSTLDIGRSLGFSASELTHILDSTFSGRSLGFMATNTLQILDASVFNKALGFIGTNSLNVLETLILQRALGFQLTDIVRVFDFSGQGQAPTFILSTLLKVLDTSQLNRALGFGTSEVVRVFDYSSFTKALGFSQLETVRTLGSLEFGKALGFSTSELIRLFDASSFGRSLTFTSSNLLHMFEASLLNKALGFTAQNSISIFSTSDLGRALSFRLTDILYLWDSITYSFEISQYIPQERAFIVTGLLQILDSLLPTKALAFTSTNTLRLFDYGTSLRAFGYTVTNTLQILDSATFLKALSFTNHALIYPTSTNTIVKALAFNIGNTVNIFASSTYQKAFIYLTTNTLNLFDSSTFLKALQFTTANSLYPSSTNTMLKALSFSLSDLANLFDVATMNKANLYTTTETLIISGSEQIGKSLTFLTDSTIKIFGHLDFTKQITVWFFELTEVGQVFESLEFSHIAVPIPANFALVLAMFASVMVFAVLALTLDHRHKKQDIQQSQ